MSAQRRAVLLLVLTALLWSLAGVLIKSICWPPAAIAGGRSALAALVLLAFVRRCHFTASLPQLGAAICYALTVTIFVFANKLTTAANAILLQYTAPVWIALCGPWYLNEKARRSDWAIMAVVFAGIALFFLDDLTVTGLWGNLLALASGTSFGWLVLFLRRQKDSSGYESVLLGNALTAALCSPFLFGSAPTAHGSVALGLLLLLVLGVFQLGLSYVCYATAIRHVTALEAILIPALEPILNPLLVLWTLGERPGPWAMVGGALVLGAVTARGLVTLRSPARG